MTKQKQRDVYEEDFEDEEPDFSDPEDFVDKISDQGLLTPITLFRHVSCFYLISFQFLLLAVSSFS